MMTERELLADLAQAMGAPEGEPLQVIGADMIANRLPSGWEWPVRNAGDPLEVSDNPRGSARFQEVQQRLRALLGARRDAGEREALWVRLDANVTAALSARMNDALGAWETALAAAEIRDALKRGVRP